VRRLRRLLEALGPAGVAGLGVLFFCLPFHFTALVPAQRELETRAAAAERVRARPSAQPVAAGGEAQQLARFHASFPPVDRLADEIEGLYAHARAANLQLQQAEYRLEAKSAGLAAYRVIVPVRGSYGQIRQFVGRVLTRMPTASVDALRFERKKTSDAQLEAQLRLTIHLRPAGEGRGL